MAKGINEQTETLLQKMYAEFRPLQANRKAIDDHVSWLRARDSNPRTVLKHLYCLNKFLATVDRKEDLRKLDKRGMEKAMSKLNTMQLSEETKRDVKAVVKQFYKHLLGDDEFYPSPVRWIKTAARKTSKTLPEILSEDEVKRMIDVTKNVRDKAIIAILYDSGIRVGELLNLRLKDVELETEPAHITVKGKTGMRRIPIWYSASYLGTYLTTIDKKDMSSPFLKAIGSWANTDRTVDRNAITKVLKEAGRKAGIQKRIYPHLFRHSRASNYANKLTEQQLKVFFGWTGDSRMASTYVHLSGRDIDNAVMKAHGREIPETEARSKLATVECPRCHESNATTSGYCTRCGAAMDVGVQVRQDEREARVRGLHNRAMEEKDAKEKAVGDAKRRKKKGE